MLTGFFYWLFNMSISAAIVGIFVLLLSKIRRIPRRIVHLLWAIPLLRMWIPVGMKSRYSFLSIFTRITTKTVVVSVPVSVPVFDGRPFFTCMNSVRAVNGYFPLTYKVDLVEKVFQVAGIVWIAVAAALLVGVLIFYRLSLWEIEDARPLRDNIYLSDKVTTPAVYGIFRSRIVLPREYEPDELKFILLHENAHIRRRDNLWRMVAIVTACVHWFNPMSWLFLRAFLVNTELACDEAVLRSCGDAEKKNYASALLDQAESRSVYASAFGGAKLRVRIERILSYRKMSVFATVSFAILAVVIAYILLTNAV